MAEQQKDNCLDIVERFMRDDQFVKYLMSDEKDPSKFGFSKNDLLEFQQAYENYEKWYNEEKSKLDIDDGSSNRDNSFEKETRRNKYK